ncbi:MAG: twin-arginine translocase subunit TatC [Alphaproteobacteria bacterium]|nr:twin-arginine translocase subunit TatC [Alphaproteobacteria bacterium]
MCAPDDAPQPLIAHLIELRTRLMYCLGVFLLAFGVSYYYSQEVFEFLVAPLTKLLQGQNRKLIYTGLTEAFLTYLKVALFTGFFVTFPMFALQIWAFMAPGLYHKEKKVFFPFLIATPFLFFLGAAFAYYVIFPSAYSFFLSFESPATETMLAIQLEAKVNEYLGFVMRLILAFGICFELPVVLSLLGRTGFVTWRGLLEKWRIAVVGIFTLAAVITPPDLLSMIGLALPLILLYGLSILMVRFLETKH